MAPIGRRDLFLGVGALAAFGALGVSLSAPAVSAAAVPKFDVGAMRRSLMSLRRDILLRVGYSAEEIRAGLERDGDVWIYDRMHCYYIEFVALGHPDPNVRAEALEKLKSRSRRLRGVYRSMPANLYPVAARNREEMDARNSLTWCRGALRSSYEGARDDRKQIAS